ncbi:hypothetical protein Tcan_15736 [Toxocara canis]|uniref:Uncharacterized protein n=1 Tax=Toxocara canis TaxID=6265 RepID=A0A0B2VM96_TOXCA|nr:hypothetical protein Tcan_15736 [Toxocara canis]
MCVAAVLLLNTFYKVYYWLFDLCEHFVASALILCVLFLVFTPILFGISTTVHFRNYFFNQGFSLKFFYLVLFASPFCLLMLRAKIAPVWYFGLQTACGMSALTQDCGTFSQGVASSQSVLFMHSFSTMSF